MSKQDTLFYKGDNYQEWEFATCHHLNAKKLGSTLKMEKPKASKAAELKECEPDMINQVMRSLPKSWENILPAIRAQTSLMTNYKDFKGKIVSEYEYTRADSNKAETSKGGGDKEGQGPRQRERKNDEKKANQVNQSRSYVLTAAKSKAGDGDWILDSGASNHMTGDKGIIKNLKNKDNLGKVTVASSNQFEITGVGSVELTGEDRPVTITGVLYVPGVSVSQ
ncbi:hypothetical protein HDU80_008539 [Chytriomyces hyalinus]|nr:hypothetical protein HDU80_008539 [Chytriomyces hyalinus]